MVLPYCVTVIVVAGCPETLGMASQAFVVLGASVLVHLVTEVEYV